MKTIQIFFLCVLSFPAITWAETFVVRSQGNSKYITGSKGYRAWIRQSGARETYSDNRGQRFTTRTVGNRSYTDSKNTYIGRGSQSGNLFRYRDNRGNSYTRRTVGNLDFYSGSLNGTGERRLNSYYYRPGPTHSK